MPRRIPMNWLSTYGEDTPVRRPYRALRPVTHRDRPAADESVRCRIRIASVADPCDIETTNRRTCNVGNVCSNVVLGVSGGRRVGAARVLACARRRAEGTQLHRLFRSESVLLPAR